jgi:ABC transporter, ATP-binding protein
MEERFLRTVREERDRGATVLLSTHIMSEVEALCDSVTIVKDGRTAYSGTLAGLRERASARIRIREGDGALRAFDVPHSQADRTLAELLAQGASVFGVDRSMERIFLGFYEEEEG